MASDAVTGVEKKRSDSSQESGASCIGWLRKVVHCQDFREVPVGFVLRSRLLGIYFSASWSPPCRDFTQILSDAYREIRELHGEESIEVVLVPLDANEADWQQYAKDMPWLSVPHTSRESILGLRMHFNVSEAPRLIIIDATGEVIEENARGGPGFGFGCDPLVAYDRLCEARRTPKASRGAQLGGVNSEG